MKRLIACFVVLIAATISCLSMAAVKDLEDRIAEVKKNITVEEQFNSELKAQLAVKETAVAEAKTKLKQIEDQIAALRKEHQMESK